MRLLCQGRNSCILIQTHETFRELKHDILFVMSLSGAISDVVIVQIKMLHATGDVIQTVMQPLLVHTLQTLLS